MPSKYCPICERITTTNNVPNFCAWGCGSLAEQDILPEFKNIQELKNIIAEQKQKIQNKKYSEIKIGDYGQLKLF